MMMKRLLPSNRFSIRACGPPSPKMVATLFFTALKTVLYPCTYAALALAARQPALPSPRSKATCRLLLAAAATSAAAALRHSVALSPLGELGWMARSWWAGWVLMRVRTPLLRR